MDYYALPGNIINADYFHRFRRNGAALKYLEKAMWGKKPQCPFCGCKSAGKWNRENWYRCNNYRCNRPFNARTKTIFQCTKIPLWKWFLACYYMLPTKGITGIRLAHELGVTRKTAWHMAHRIREAMKGSRERLLLEKLGGIIELDEIYPGGKEGNKPAYKKLHMGSGVGGKMSALGVVERGDHGNAITTGFPDKATAEDFISFLEKEFQHGDVVELTGGEPTLFHGLNMLLDWLKKHGAKVIIRTNGLHLGEWRKNYDNLVAVLARHDSDEDYMSERKKYLLPCDLVLDGIPESIKQKEPFKSIFVADETSPLTSYPFKKARFVSADGKVRFMACCPEDLGTVWDYKPRAYQMCDKCSHMLGAWNLIQRIEK